MVFCPLVYESMSFCGFYENAVSAWVGRGMDPALTAKGDGWIT